MCTCDKQYGGSSHVDLTMGVDSKEDSGDENGPTSDKEQENRGQLDSAGNNVFHGFPFMRFEGSLEMSRRRSKELGVSGGFCAVRGELDCPEVITEYEGFEIIYRNVLRVSCVINVTMENMTPEDVYQTRMILPSGNKWMKLHIPFSRFRLTLIGKDREAQGMVEGSVLDTFGILIRSHDGPFRIDIHSIKVLEKLDSNHVVHDAIKRPSFFRQIS